jgi:hypothetical protein
MKKLLLIAGMAALAACGQQEQAAPANDMNEAVAEPDANMTATPAGFQINETTWTFTREGKAIKESVDASGNYIANAGAEHYDHGTVVMKDDKACFTSAMDKEGEVCWTTAPTEIGQSFETTSDKGEKLTVTRVAY